MCLVDTPVSLPLVVFYVFEAESVLAAVAESESVVGPVIVAAAAAVVDLTGDGWVLVHHIRC